MEPDDFTIVPLPWYFFFAIILFAITGCATQDEEIWQRICYEQPLGRTDQGLMVVRHFCVKENE